MSGITECFPLLQQDHAETTGWEGYCDCDPGEACSAERTVGHSLRRRTGKYGHGHHKSGRDSGRGRVNVFFNFSSKDVNKSPSFSQLCVFLI